MRSVYWPLFSFATLSAILFLRLSFALPTPSPTIPPVATDHVDNRTDLVPFEKWHCGAYDFDKTFSHQLAEDSCSSRMYEANLCCISHDLCYTEEGKTQEDCDRGFCFCLNRTLVDTLPPGHGMKSGCSAVSTFFCDAVELFGSAAHANAQKAPTKPATSTTPPVVTTTPTEVILDEGSEASIESPNAIAEFIAHNVSLECHDDELSDCIEGLHHCVFPSTQSITPPQQAALQHGNSACSREFCSCLTEKNLAHTGDERARCRNALKQICSERHTEQHLVKLVRLSPQGSDRLHFSSINIRYTNGDGVAFWHSAGVVALFSLTFLLALFLFYKIYKACKNRKLSHALTPECSLTTAQARRHTLPTLRYSAPQYQHLGEEKDRAERGHRHHPHQHHHASANFHLGANLLHLHSHPLPINSSKSRLLGEEDSNRSTGKLSSASSTSSSSMTSSQE